MTAALVSRLMHNCYLLLFPGENNRLRESSIYRFVNKTSNDHVVKEDASSVTVVATTSK